LAYAVLASERILGTDPMMPSREAAMTDWWSELDDEIVNCLVDQESLTPAELSSKVGMSTEAVTSLLGRLAQEGRITIVRVARTSG
jgi:DNA-binding GntR family transcriptional regulator